MRGVSSRSASAGDSESPSEFQWSVTSCTRPSELAYFPAPEIYCSIAERVPRPSNRHSTRAFLPCPLSGIERCRARKDSWIRIRSATYLFFNARPTTCMDSSNRPFYLPSKRMSEICAQRNAKTCRCQTVSCPVGDIRFECKNCWRSCMAASGLENSNSRSQWLENIFVQSSQLVGTRYTWPFI